jgi:hypothetical protein
MVITTYNLVFYVNRHYGLCKGIFSQSSVIAFIVINNENSQTFSNRVYRDRIIALGYI